MTSREGRHTAWPSPVEPGWLAIALLTLALVGVAAQARALETTPLEITLDPTRFTGQMVTVHDTLTNLLPRGQMGGPGAVFDVMERGAFVRVLSLTPPPLGAYSGQRSRAALARSAGSGWSLTRLPPCSWSRSSSAINPRQAGGSPGSRASKSRA